MKQALKVKQEIDQLNEAIKKTKSPYLKRDYLKAIHRKKNDLKEYCKYKSLSYAKVMKIKGEN